MTVSIETLTEVNCVADKSCRIDNPDMVEAIQRLADALESLRLDLHRYFSEEMPTGRMRHGDDI